MPLRGTAFLALWNDLDPARDAEYNEWHTLEHVPERAGIPGVVAARRYVAPERSEGRYFTLYELDSLAVLQSDSYRDVVDHPTPWTQSMRPSFRNFHRAPCSTLFSAGAGCAACIVAIRIALLHGARPDAIDWPRALAFDEGVCIAAHAGRVVADPGFVIRNETRTGAARDEAEIVVLIESADRRNLQRCIDAVQRNGFVNSANLIEVPAVFDLAFALERSQLADPGARRQKPRDELRAKWQRATDLR